MIGLRLRYRKPTPKMYFRAAVDASKGRSSRCYKVYPRKEGNNKKPPRVVYTEPLTAQDILMTVGVLTALGLSVPISASLTLNPLALCVLIPLIFWGLLILGMSVISLFK